MRFGVYSTLLLATAANGLLLATLLVSRVGAHTGSRWLAALVASLVLRTVPYVLGFAGAYDAHPWLTFAPFDLAMAWGPLFWCYVVTLSTGHPPRYAWRHFVPVALQVAYQLVCFALPLPSKWSWYSGVHLRVVEPGGALLVVVSLGLYAGAAWRTYGRWQRWLDANVSNREESRLDWLRVMLRGLIGTACVGTGMMLVHLAIRPLDYFARLPIVGTIAALTYLLGLLSFRFGRGAIPMAGPANGPPDATPASPNELSDRLAGEALSSANAASYAQQARAWRERVVAARWHHDPQLRLATLAVALGTSARTLSRVLNEGAGVSFNAFINGLRVDDAIHRLSQPGAPDVLRVAMDVGFASKASFNRAFKTHAGTTPTAVRDGARGDMTAQNPPMPHVAPSESRR